MGGIGSGKRPDAPVVIVGGAGQSQLPKLAVGAKDAAEALGLSKSSLYKLMADGRLKSVTVGTRRLIRVSDMEAFLADAGGAGA